MLLKCLTMDDIDHFIIHEFCLSYKSTANCLHCCVSYLFNSKIRQNIKALTLLHYFFSYCYFSYQKLNYLSRFKCSFCFLIYTISVKRSILQSTNLPPLLFLRYYLSDRIPKALFAEFNDSLILANCTVVRREYGIPNTTIQITRQSITNAKKQLY